MDPAAAAANSAEHLQRVVFNQGNLLGVHHNQLQDLRKSQQAIGTQVADIGDRMQELAQRPSPPRQPVREDTPRNRECFVPSPDPYDGASGGCRGFLLQCRFVFNQQPRTYASNYARVAYTVGLLRGRALVWAEAWLCKEYIL